MVSAAQILRGDIAAVRKFKMTLSLLAHWRNCEAEKVDRNGAILHLPERKGFLSATARISCTRMLAFIMSSGRFTTGDRVHVQSKSAVCNLNVAFST